MNPIPAALYTLVALMLLFAVTWLLALKLRKWAIVDAIWSFSIAFNAIVFAILRQADLGLATMLVCGVALLYSLRLGLHLLKRTLKHQEDDPRYLEFAREWGSKANARMLLFYQFQAAGSFALSIPFFIAIDASQANYTPWIYIGVLWCLAAIAGETMADQQLARFKREQTNPNEVCRSGLWRYSRHPNYFFQWIFWLGLIPLCSASDYWWTSLISPLLMLHFLLNVTGIPPTEKRAVASKGDAYRAYQRETSSFLPLPPHPDPTQNRVRNL